MASYGVQIVLPLPVAGNVQWDGPLNDMLQSIIDVLAQRVTVDGLDVSKTLDLQGNALISADNIQFVTGVDPGVANSIYYSAGGELFVRDGANRAIQLTSGGIVNVAGSGGFGGDYAASNQNGASFTNSTSTFTFTAAGGTTYASIEAGSHILHRGSANSNTINAASNLTGNRTFDLPNHNVNMSDTLPTAAPAVMIMDATGTINYRSSSSFTQYIDVASGRAGAGSPTYETTLLWGWSMVASAAVDIPITYNVGDSLTSIAYGTQGIGTTGTLIHVDNQAFVATPIRCAFNVTTPGLQVLQSGTPTLTGTFPYTPPGTGSLKFRVQASPGGIGDSLHTFRLVWNKHLI